MDIVESNPFKYLCHLSLKTSVGSDAEVKKYLCEVTSCLKKEIKLLQDKYSHLSSASSDEIDKLKNLLELKTEEINLMRNDMHAQTSSLVNKHFQEIAQEKEKILKIQSDISAKFETEKLEMEKRHGVTISNLEERTKVLESENRELLQSKYKLETLSQEFKNRIKTYEDDQKLLQQELVLTRKQNAKLDHDYHEKQRMVNTLQNKLTTLESDLKEKQSMAVKHQDYINQLCGQKKTLEDQVSSLGMECEKLKNSCNNLSSDLNKANEIIRKFQSDARNSNSKIRLQVNKYNKFYCGLFPCLFV